MCVCERELASERKRKRESERWFIFDRKKQKSYGAIVCKQTEAEEEEAEEEEEEEEEEKCHLIEIVSHVHFAGVNIFSWGDYFENLSLSALE